MNKPIVLLADHRHDFRPDLTRLLKAYQLRLTQVAANDNIPGSYWGESEAGLIQDQLFVRSDTPVHSALHEACHYICMSPERRATLHTDAGGRTPVEENATCYLQCLLADELPGYSQQQMFADMDSWGYSFRLGSSQKWFEQDAKDAQDALINWGLIDQGKARFCLRMDAD